MGVHNAANIGAQFVDGEVHRHLRSAFPFAGDLIAVQVAQDQIVATHHALANSGGCRQNQIIF
jgi:hypothetical protein